MKYRKDIVFVADGKEHFLIRVMNIGKSSDELKFSFNSHSNSSFVLHSRNTGIIDEQDIQHPYIEATYHSDGTFMFKFPNYPLAEKTYSNPHGKGIRRISLNKIMDFEPIFQVEVFQYNLCERITKTNNNYKLFNNDLFNGEPFACIIGLLNCQYSDFLETNNKSSLSVRIRNIGEGLDLGLILGRVNHPGHIIELANTSQNIFTNNNHVQVIQRNTENR